MTTPNQHDHDIPILTDIIDDQEIEITEAQPVADDAELLAQIEEEITHRIFAELSVQIPLLIEAAAKTCSTRRWRKTTSGINDSIGRRNSSCNCCSE
jgi:hypothetical protein